MSALETSSKEVTMTDYEKWRFTDADFTLEQLADAIASRLTWDAKVDEWQREGRSEWNNHRPFNPLSTEKLETVEEGHAN